MSNEEFRRGIPSDNHDPLPKGEQGPCLRGTLDLDLYNRTGEVKMIEPLEEFVPPVDPMDATPINPQVRRKGMRILNPKKPSKESLERDLRSGMSAAEIAEKYESAKVTVFNWIKNYGLQGIKGVQKPEQVDAPIIDGMVQTSPSLEELEQFHTDTEVQELPKVEMDQSINIPQATKEEIAEMYAKTEYAEDIEEDAIDSLSGEAYDEIMVKVEVQLVEPVAETKPDVAMNERLLDELDHGGDTDSTEEKKADPTQVTAEPADPLDELWQGAADKLTALRVKYEEQADQAFRAQLVQLILAVTRGRGLFG